MKFFKKHFKLKNMRKINYIFTDLDGPILNGKHRHYRCYADIVSKYGGVALSIDEYWTLKRAKVKRDLILEKTKFRGTYQQFFDEWIFRIEQQEYLALDILKPHVIAVLTKWKSISNNIFLITMRQSKELLLWQLLKFNIVQYFDNIISCHPLEKNTKFGAVGDLEFESGVFIGDTEEDERTAQKLGIPFYGILNGLRNKDNLKADKYYNEIVEINLQKDIMDDSISFIKKY